MKSESRQKTKEANYTQPSGVKERTAKRPPDEPKRPGLHARARDLAASTSDATGFERAGGSEMVSARFVPYCWFGLFRGEGLGERGEVRSWVWYELE